MKIIVLGAAHIGRALVDALHEEHEITVIDISADRLAALSDRYDVRTVEGDGTTEQVIRKAGVEEADLFIGCSPREEANLVGAMLAKRLSGAQTIVRSTSTAYLDAWRERHLEVDFMVSPELETAERDRGDARAAGRPPDRHVRRRQGPDRRVRRARPRAAQRPDRARPAQRRDAGRLQGRRDHPRRRDVVPRGDEQILPGDRVVVIASPDSARAWAHACGRKEERVNDVVIFGAGQMGTTIARVLLERGIRVRIVDAERERMRHIAERLPGVRAFHAHAFDPEFLDHERIGRASAAVFALNDDARNLYGAILAKRHGVRMTIALVHDEVSVEVYEAGGVDVTIDPRQVTAEEMVRFAHDPRIRQIAMLEQDRFEVLDLTVRADSDFIDKPFTELPATGSVIGAVIRNGDVRFPHKTDTLHAGDRVIVFVESRRASLVEKAL